MDIKRVPAGSIVVGIDGSASSEGALSWAIDQASLEQRALAIVHAVEPSALSRTGGLYAIPADYGVLLEQSDQAARVLVTSAVKLATDRHPHLTVYPVLSHADPRSALLALAGSAAMIVVGSRGLGPVTSLLLGSVSVSVSKHADCPVVVHRPGPTSASARGILLWVDGTENSLPAIEFAFRMASWRGLRLTAMHTSWDARAMVALHEGSAMPDPTPEALLVAESIAGMNEKFPDVDVRVRLNYGFADKQVVAVSSDYDLIVIGHLPLSALNELIYRSMAPAVVEHAHGAVAVVPS